MNRIRYLAAGLLCLTGIIHVGRLGMADAPVVIVVVFGVAYLIIGGLLFRNNKIAYYAGAIVPLIGLCVGPAVLPNPPILLAAFLGAIEIGVVVSCLSLIRRSRHGSGRFR
jgi:4-amino-4-deoxy-L-arabinose transferase-like glycosyltransferase